MDQFKEWLESSYIEILNELKQEQDNDGCSYLNGKQNFCLNTIVEYEKYHPTTKKLSEILNDLSKINEDVEIKQGKNIVIEFGSKYSLLGRIVLKDNKISNINIESFVNINAIKWLYQLWVDETEIIIDVDEGK